jgi:hypothetical protein
MRVLSLQLGFRFCAKPWQKARRERLLREQEPEDNAQPLELAKYSLERAGVSAAEMENKQCDCSIESPHEPPKLSTRFKLLLLH